MAELIWTPLAIKDIDSIAKYIAKDNLLAARNKVEHFLRE
jgi:plasmid stabilization system protein ParE